MPIVACLIYKNQILTKACLNFLVAENNLKLDPRARPNIGVEAVSGSLTDRALALISVLNGTMGYEGMGTKVLTDDLGKTETLGLYNIDQDYQWQGKQAFYYQSSVLRIEEIQNQLSRNLNKVQDDLSKNVSGLFDILKNKNTGLENYKQAIIDAKNTEDLEKASQALDKELDKLFTSDEALNTIINEFFGKFNFNISRMNDEIFSLLDDNDADFADGSTDQANIIYLLPVSNSQGTTIVKLKGIDALRARIFEESQKTISNFDQDTFVKLQVEANFAQSKLKISNELIDKLIEKNIVSKEQLNSFISISDVFNRVGFANLLSAADDLYGTTGQATYNKLFDEHINFGTPKYFEDKRSLLDVIKGKTEDNPYDPQSKIFLGLGDQINAVNYGVESLFKFGYDQNPKSELQQNIRNSPISAIVYLESLKDNLDEASKSEMNTYISKLLDRQKKTISYGIEQINKSESPDKDARTNALRDILRLLDNYSQNPNKALSLEIKNKIKDQTIAINHKGNLEEVALFENYDFANISLKDFYANIDKETKLLNPHRQLYAMEQKEADKMNTQAQGQKLPEAREDGSLPRSNLPIPPNIGPTILSAVIGRIGDVMIDQAALKALNPDLPDQKWFDDNIASLKTINDNLSRLGSSSAGEAFVKSLIKNFKDILIGFYQKNNPLKITKEKLAKELVDITDANQKLQVLLPNTVYEINSDPQYLDNIEKALDQNLFDNNNFINSFGLTNTKKYLTLVIDSLDDIDYPKAIQVNYDQISDLSDQINKLHPEQDSDKINQLQAQIDNLAADILKLQKDSDNLDKATKLYKPVFKLESDYRSAVEKFTKDKPSSQSDEEFLQALELSKQDEYRQASLDYARSITDFEYDGDQDGKKDLEVIFKNSLTQANLDLDKNGKNDFVDIQGIIDNIGHLANNIKDTFGSKQAVKGDISKQGLRRLILLMFVLSLIEPSDWESRRQDADLTKYMDSSADE